MYIILLIAVAPRQAMSTPSPVFDALFILLYIGITVSNRKKALTLIFRLAQTGNTLDLFNLAALELTRYAGNSLKNRVQCKL